MHLLTMLQEVETGDIPVFKTSVRFLLYLMISMYSTLNFCYSGTAPSSSLKEATLLKGTRGHLEVLKNSGDVLLLV